MDKNYITINNSLLQVTKQFREQFLQMYQASCTEKWMDTSDYGQKFSKTIGKDYYIKAQKIQQKLILAGDTTKWDLPMFISIYKTFRPGKQHKKIHNIHDIIKDIRNKVAHHSTFQIENNEFELMWNTLNTCLNDLGFDTTELHKIKNSDQKNDEDNTIHDDNKYSNQLAQAYEGFKTKYYNSAISTLSFILNQPRISPKMQEEIYLLRCESYFQIYNQQQPLEKDDEQLLNAICDGKLVIRQNPNQFQAYFVVGQCFQNLKQLEKAQEYYRKCKLLNNNHNELNEKLASLSEEINLQACESQFDPRNFPKTLEEHNEDIMKDLQVNQQFLDASLNMLIKRDPDFADIVKAHEYRDGSKNVSQNYQTAVHYYSKLAYKQNAEAMFNLAMLMIDGKGTKKDFKRAVALIEEAANLPPTKTFKGQTYPVVGVQEAQMTLGTWYLRGIYLDKNYSLARKWLEESLKNGSERAANDIGLMYLHGEGVSQDFNKAEQYLLLGFKRGDHNSASNLTCLYLAIGDGKKAKQFHEISLKNGHMKAKSRDKEIREQIAQIDSEIQDYPYNQSQQKSVFQIIKDFIVPKLSLLNIFRYIKNSARFDIETLKKYVLQGSESAILLLKTVQFYQAGISYLNNLKEQEDFEEMINNLASALSLEEYVCEFSSNQAEVIINIAEQILIAKERSQLDQNARIVRGFFYLCYNEGQKCIQFYKECIKLYPKQKQFYKALGQYYAKNKQFQEGLKMIEKALDLDPNNYSIQYNIAPILRNLGSHKLAIDEYNRFLNLAPSDDRKVPECLYSIANCYNALGKQNLTREFYEKGLKAESQQLPFFLPYQSTSKQFIKFYLSQK